MIPTHSPSAAKAFCRAAARMELGVTRLTQAVCAEVDAYAQATYAASAAVNAASSAAYADRIIDGILSHLESLFSGAPPAAASEVCDE